MSNKLPDIPLDSKSIYSIDLMTEYTPTFSLYVKHDNVDSATYIRVQPAILERITDIEIQLTDRKAPLIEITIAIESMFISNSIFDYSGKINTFSSDTEEFTSAIDGITSYFDLGKKIKLDFGYYKFFSTIENYDITDFKIQLKNGGITATIIAQKLGSRKNITYPAIVYTSGTIIDVLRDLLYRTGIKLDRELDADIKQRLQELDEDIFSAELELTQLKDELNTIQKQNIESIIYDRTEQDTTSISKIDEEYKTKVFLLRSSIIEKETKYKKLKETKLQTGLVDDSLKLIEFNPNEPFVVAPNTISKTIQEIMSVFDATFSDINTLKNKIENGIALKRNTDITLSYGKPNSEIKSITFKTEDLQEKARYSGVPQIQRNTANGITPTIERDIGTTPTTPTTPIKIKSTIEDNSTTSLATPTGSTRNTKSQFERAKINKNARNVLTASVEMLTGYPAFYPLDKIYLDLGNSFYSGIYVIDHVIHEFSDTGFKTKMELNKEANKKQIPKKKQNTL